MKRSPEECMKAIFDEYCNYVYIIAANKLKSCGSAEDVEECGAAKHIFTHVEWEMRGFRLLCREETGNFTWATTEEMKNTYSIPTAFRKFQMLL